MHTSRPTSTANRRLCIRTFRNSRPSLPSCPVTAHAMTSDCAAIIFPMTPPALLAAPIRIGLSPSRLAVTTWKLPNSAFDPASVPLSATPSQPIIVPKNGNSRPVCDIAMPIHRAEKWEQPPGMRHRHAHGRVHAAVARQIPHAEHGHDRHHAEPQPPQALAEHPDRLTDRKSVA